MIRLHGEVDEVVRGGVMVLRDRKYTCRVSTERLGPVFQPLVGMYVRVIGEVVRGTPPPVDLEVEGVQDKNPVVFDVENADAQ